MPFKLVIEHTDGTVKELGPLANDNPQSVFGLEDRKIQRVGNIWAKKMREIGEVTDSYCIHYEK